MKKNRQKKIKDRSLFKKAYGFGPFNLAAVSLTLALVGQYFLYVNKWLVPGLVMFTLAIMVFILADKSSKKEGQEYPLDARLEAFAFLAIMLLAVFFRLYLIDRLPAGCFRDEGQNGNEAINIMNGIEVDGTKLPVYIERWTQNAAMYMYFVAAFFKLFGIGVMQVRAVSVVFGILCIPAFYFLVRYLMGPRMAIVGGFLMAVSSWHVNFSRIGFLGIPTVFFAILCFYFAWRTYVKRKPFDFIILGILTALALYTYLAGRLIPVGLVLFCLYIFAVEMKFYVKNYKKILLALIAFMVVISPLLLYAVKNPQQFMSRSAVVSIFNQEMLHEVGGRYVEKDGKNKHWTKLYMESFAYTMLMYNYKGDGNPRHNSGANPMLDFMTGIFMVLGFGYAFVNIFKPRYFLLMSMYFSFMQAGLFSTESPQAYRTITEIPIVILFAVIAVWKTMGFAREQYGKSFTKKAMIAGLVILGYVAYENYDRYFVKFANNPGSWAEFSTDEYLIGRYVHGLGDEWQTMVKPAWAESYTFVFAAYPFRNYIPFSLADCVPIKSTIRQNFSYVLDETYLPLLPILKRMYPEGKYNDMKHKFIPGEILYFTYEVPYESVKKYQEKVKKNGLTGAYYRGIDWKGSPLFTRLDPFILFNWDIDPVMGPFSVKWTGRFKADKSGEYTFITKSNDFSDLFIDGKLVLKNAGTGKGSPDGRGTVRLSAGYHAFELKYHESIHYSKMQLFWRNPETLDEEVVPSEVLYPQ
jgi:4-amino-4-deoxy-L-arabinose transferase-like glycosyltransferase